MAKAEPPFTDVEFAREQARKGGLRAQELRRLRADDPEEYLRQTFAAESPGLIALLLDAAHGRGAFQELPPEKRLSAISQALAYGVGRPATQAKPPPKEPEKAEPGLVVE